MNIENSILGFVLGDSIGLGFKYDDYKYQFSSNTSFLIATIESLIHSNKIDYIDISKNYLDVVNYSKYTSNGVVIDLGSTTLKSIMRYNTNNPIECGDSSIYSNGNGSLSRILPIALFIYTKKDFDFRKIITDFSSLTHMHEISSMGCYIFGKFIQFLMQGKSKETAFKLIKELDYSNYNKKTKEEYNRIFNNDFLLIIPKNSDYIVNTLEVVFYSILTTNNFEDAIKRGLKFGGDMNTYCALIGGIAGLIYPDIINNYKYSKQQIIAKISIYFNDLVIQKNQIYI